METAIRPTERDYIEKEHNAVDLWAKVGTMDLSQKGRTADFLFLSPQSQFNHKRGMGTASHAHMSLLQIKNPFNDNVVCVPAGSTKMVVLRNG
jgi:cellobiose-specific phosphotransferase system component IIB